MLLNFLYLLNEVSNDGKYKKYATKVIGRYAPVLTEAMQHVVVDTTTADQNFIVFDKQLINWKR